MFVGHYSAALIAKRIAPDISLPVFFIACQITDFCWGLFVLLGIEKVRFVDHINATNSMDLYYMPYTHSLPGALLWGIIIAGAYWMFDRTNTRRMRNTLLFFGVVISHWFLDVFAHIPDLPLWYDSFKVGLGLWNYVLLELTLELVLVWASIIATLEVVGNNRKRYIVFGIVMTAFQIISVVTQTPQYDWQIAGLLMASYSVMTLLSHWAEQHQPAASPRTSPT
jgi:hypothetical protein